jgi:hypothetical protein
MGGARFEHEWTEADGLLGDEPWPVRKYPD